MASRATSDRQRMRPGAGDGLLLAAAALVIIVAVGLGTARYVGSSPVERGGEGAVASVAFAAVLATPAILILLARADRPALLLAAGWVLFPLSVISLAGATLPLLIPAVMVLVAYVRRSRTLRFRPRVLAPVTAAIEVVLVLAAGASLLLLHDDPRSYSTPTGGGSTTDVITFAESMLALGWVAAALAAGWYLAARRR